eukprot:ANDGO_00008.mRNA.1 Calcium-activated potassium channel slo-1
MVFTAFEKLQLSASFHEKKVSHDVEYFMFHSSFGMVYDSFQILASLASCFLYCAYTYYTEAPKWMATTDLALATVFLFDFILQLYMSPNRLKQLLSFQTLIDVVTIVPVYLDLFGIDEFGNVAFLRVFRLFRVFRVFRSHRNGSLSSEDLGQDSLLKLVSNLLLTVFVLIFVSSSIFQLIEGSGGYPLDFHDAVYFIVVSTTTVGYGDITPKTFLGKMYIAAFLLFAISLIPYQTTKMVELLRLRSRFSSNFVSPRGANSVLLIGDLSIPRLRSIIFEMFHPCHGNSKTHVVLLSPGVPDSDMELFLRNKFSWGRLSYVQGSALSSSDIRRTDVDHLVACLIISDNTVANGLEEDQETVLRCLAIRNACKTIPIIVELGDTDEKHHAISAGVHYLIVRNEMKANLLSRSIIAPGSSTLIGNLLTRVPLLGKSALSEIKGTWIEEYYHGAQHSISSFSFPSISRHFTFLDFCLFASSKYNIICVGLLRSSSLDGERPSQSLGFSNVVEERPHVVLFPNDRNPLSPGDALFAITKNDGDCFFVVEDLKRQYPYSSGVRVGVSSNNDDKESGASSVESDSSTSTLQTKNPTSVKVVENTTVHPTLPDHLFSATVAHVTADRFRRQIHSRNMHMTTTRKHQVRISTCSNAIGSHYLKNALRGNVQESEGGQPAPDAMYHKCSSRAIEDCTTNQMPQTVSGHIVVCGNMHAVEHFVGPLRRTDLGPPVDIVILTAKPTDIHWTRIDMYPNIWIIEGEADNSASLSRCRVDSALHVVYLASERQFSNCEPEFVDFQAILLYNTLFHEYGKVPCMLEMVFSANMSFLHPKLDMDRFKQLSSVPMHAIYAPLFASGTVFADTFIDQFAAQSYFNPFVIDITNQLIGSLSDSLHPSEQKQLFRMKIPSVVIQRRLQKNARNGRSGKPLTWKFCFKTMVTDFSILPVALYRTTGAFEPSPLPFVYTSPPRQCIVDETDEIFFLANTPPTFK